MFRCILQGHCNVFDRCLSACCTVRDSISFRFVIVVVVDVVVVVVVAVVAVAVVVVVESYCFLIDIIVELGVPRPPPVY